MRVLVTGGAGYIGSHAMRALADAGHSVIGYDNLSTGHAYLAEGFELIEADIANVRTLKKALRGVDAVLHFAAWAYVGESVENPRKYFDNNVRKALTFLDTVVDSGVRYVVFSSTCAVYGSVRTIPITESFTRDPMNPYGVSKLLFERALEAYSAAYGLRAVSLRYFNAAGAHDDMCAGEDHNPETHLIPLVINAALEGTNVKVFGNDYPTEDGTCIRDYTHVCDLADAHVKALAYLDRGGPTTAINLGTGTGQSVLDVIRTVETVCGKRVTYTFAARRPGDPAELVADPSRAERLLGWKAQRSLTDMVASAWRWKTRAATATAATVVSVHSRAAQITAASQEPQSALFQRSAD